MSFSLHEKEDTIVALATPQGVGAIAVIRLSGKNAIRITNDVFKGKDLEKQESHTIHFGTIRDGERIIDEVLVSLFIAPKSFTKENVVEISTHGSSYIVNQVIKLLIRKGARPARPGRVYPKGFSERSI
jgi:tRNA modification GTPase